MMGFYEKLKNAFGGITDETVKEIDDKEELKRMKLEKQERSKREKEEKKKGSQSGDREKRQQNKAKRHPTGGVKEVDVTQDDDFIRSVTSASASSSEDILEREGIPSNYEIDKKMLFAEDIDNVKFREQVPVGYDQGDVRNFMRLVKGSIEYYTDIINQRQEHISRLSSIIENLIVDNENLKYRNESAEGVNIMTSESNHSLEIEVDSLKIENQRLVEENESLRRSSLGDQDNSEELEKLKSKNRNLSNSLSILEREMEDLKSELREKEITISEFYEYGYIDKGSSNSSNSGSQSSDGLDFPVDDEIPEESFPEDDSVSSGSDDLNFPEDEENFEPQEEKYKRKTDFLEDEDEDIIEYMNSRKDVFTKQSEAEPDFRSDLFEKS